MAKGKKRRLLQKPRTKNQEGGCCSLTSRVHCQMKFARGGVLYLAFKEWTCRREQPTTNRRKGGKELGALHGRKRRRGGEERPGEGGGKFCPSCFPFSLSRFVPGFSFPTCLCLLKNPCPDWSPCCSKFRLLSGHLPVASNQHQPLSKGRKRKEESCGAAP